MIDIGNLTLSRMWAFILVTITATGTLLFLYKDKVILGIRAITTWDRDGISKLHKKFGVVTTIFWTFMIFFIGTHILNLIFLIIIAILWAVGIWDPNASK